MPNSPGSRLRALAVTALVLLVVGVTDAAADPEAGPAATVASFYGWYLDASRVGSPLADGRIAEREDLRDDFRLHLRLVLDGLRGGGFDPLLCAQDVPAWVRVVEVRTVARRAFVRVGTSFSGHGFEVVLERDGDTWRIDDVRCGSPRRLRPASFRST
jgi:hypothetical protein